jgi:hypothetical protein
LDQGRSCKLKSGLIPFHIITLTPSIVPGSPAHVLQARPAQRAIVTAVAIAVAVSVRTCLSCLQFQLSLQQRSCLISFPSSFHPSPAHSLWPSPSQSNPNLDLESSYPLHLQSIAFPPPAPSFFKSLSCPIRTFYLHKRLLRRSFPTQPANICPSRLSFDWIFELNEPCRQPTAPATATPV